MRTAEIRPCHDRSRLRCPSDLTDAEWSLIASLIPPAKHDGNKRMVDDGGVLVMATPFGPFPFLRKPYADGGYQGPAFRAGRKRVPREVDVEIVKPSDQAKGFAALPGHGSSGAASPSTYTSTNRCRRIAKDWENLDQSALAFPRQASIRLLLRKLGEPAT